MRDPEILEKSFGFSHWMVRDPGMLEIVERNADRIIAVFSGHLHLTGIREQKGVYHVVPAGTYGYPADFASIEVYSDRLEVQMHAVPNEWQTCDCDIHGQPRHKINYTDNEHQDHEHYLWGNPEERKAIIPIKRVKLSLNDEDIKLRVYHEVDGKWVLINNI
jgi:hypothetical protein